MSFAEVSKSMGELAAAITKKNQELDRLKNEYERKLRLVETYLSHLPAAESESSRLDASDFISSLEDLRGPVTCPHCSNKMFDMAENTDFVLVPKNRLRPMIGNVADAEKLQSDPQQKLQIPPLPDPSPRIQQHNTQSKSKRTCSYCNKPGHSRARCFTRLSRESPSG